PLVCFLLPFENREVVPVDQISRAPLTLPLRPSVAPRPSGPPVLPASMECLRSKPQTRSAHSDRDKGFGTTSVPLRPLSTRQLHPSAWNSWFFLQTMYDYESSYVHRNLWRGINGGSLPQTGPPGAANCAAGRIQETAMSYDFLVETYASERIKVLSVWSEFRDEDLPFRPRLDDPRGRSLREQMIHQCVSEDLWFRTMLAID